MSNKNIGFLLVCGLWVTSTAGIASAGSGEQMWTLGADAKYYDAQRVHLPVEYSVLPAYITAAASNVQYSVVVNEFMKGIDGSKSWILLQEINVEGASFSASLLYVAPHDNRPYAVTFGVVGGTAYRHKARRLRHQQTIELLSQRLTGRDNIDYSESQIMDGTAVYVTAHSAGGLKRAAIYEPEAVEKGNGSSLESHRSLAKLVAKIKTTIPGPHE